MMDISLVPLSSALKSKPKAATTSLTLVPQFYLVGTRQNCPLPATGKYWAWRFGSWLRVEVTQLPRGGGTGTLVYAPRDRRGYPWHSSAALQDCQAFWGPVRAWGDKPPRIAKTVLKAYGLLR